MSDGMSPRLPRSIRPASQRSLESYVERLEALRADAEADGLNQLEYLIGLARLQAEQEIKTAQRERENQIATHKDLWRPA